MKLPCAILVALLCSISCNASAAVAVNEQILQQGEFVKPHCQPDSKEPDYNDCICDAEVRYPELSGMANKTIEDGLNAWFKEQAGKAVCEGEKVTPPAVAIKPTQSHLSVSVRYEVTFSSPTLFSFKFTDWDYTGGAHGNGSVSGVIVDLKNGRLLTVGDLFAPENMDAVNQQIFDILAAKPEEEVFHDQIEARKGSFIKNNQCQGCTLILTPTGVHVLFQTYEVAPYSEGNTDVALDTKYVSYPPIKEALAMQASPALKGQ